MAIETAFIAPILLVLVLGGFEVSSMVVRQTESQSAAAVACAAVPETAEARAAVRDILVTSTGLTSDQVAITQIHRCGTTQDYVVMADTCGSATQHKFIRVDLADTYAPVWTKFGITSGFDYIVSRTVQIG